MIGENWLITQKYHSYVIINLAAEHRDDVRPRSLYDEVNVEGAKNVCKVAEEKGIKKIIFTSSVAVYGFAEPNTDENGKFAPFDDYGRTKMLAEQVYRKWYEKDPNNRCLVIVRPTVVLGEQNRGNVYNLLSQIAKGRFIMVGNGQNKKTMAYVENVAAFLEFVMGLGSGIHVFNYADKPDLDMVSLVNIAKAQLGVNGKWCPALPYPVGYVGGLLCDAISTITGRRLPISSIRIKKFCANTRFSSAKALAMGFRPPYTLHEGLRRTIQYEFCKACDGSVAG